MYAQNIEGSMAKYTTLKYPTSDLISNQKQPAEKCFKHIFTIYHHELLLCQDISDSSRDNINDKHFMYPH